MNGERCHSFHAQFYLRPINFLDGTNTYTSTQCNHKKKKETEKKLTFCFHCLFLCAFLWISISHFCMSCHCSKQNKKHCDMRANDQK